MQFKEIMANTILDRKNTSANSSLKFGFPRTFREVANNCNLGNLGSLKNPGREMIDKAQVFKEKKITAAKLATANIPMHMIAAMKSR